MFYDVISNDLYIYIAPFLSTRSYKDVQAIRQVFSYKFRSVFCCILSSSFQMQCDVVIFNLLLYSLAHHTIHHSYVISSYDCMGCKSVCNLTCYFIQFNDCRKNVVSLVSNFLCYVVRCYLNADCFKIVIYLGNHVLKFI